MGTSTHGVSAYRHIDTSTHRHIGTSTHRHIGVSAHRHLDPTAPSQKAAPRNLPHHRPISAAPANPPRRL
ncbi:hypothetical protein C6P87_12315 [Burkholderia sp. AU12872]|nr:hypothetical protein EGY28_08795 [Burkholderia dolosa]PRE49762.1 hypothetical protein C6P87_12315 [Burkholderia sp. AU12872]